MSVLPKLFNHILAKPPEKKHKAGVGDEEAEQFQEQQSLYRSNTLSLLNSTVFKIMLIVSKVSKAPIT
eukprot:5904581-Pyramimonas_sp.AAC.1